MYWLTHRHRGQALLLQETVESEIVENKSGKLPKRDIKTLQMAVFPQF
jgi:hypothetical protein